MLSVTVGEGGVTGLRPPADRRGELLLLLLLLLLMLRGESVRVEIQLVDCVSAAIQIAARMVKVSLPVMKQDIKLMLFQHTALSHQHAEDELQDLHI